MSSTLLEAALAYVTVVHEGFCLANVWISGNCLLALS